MDCTCLTNERALLGESPVWSAEDNSVFWVDILGQKLHRTQIDNQETLSWDMPGHPGMIALRQKGGLVVALDDGLYAFDPQSGQLNLLIPLETNEPENRPNDGKCDSQGRLWVGTMNKTDGNLPSGNFYRIEPDLSVSKISAGLRIPNGLAWNPDNSVMLRTDTRSGIVRSMPFDPCSGTCGAGSDYFPFDRPTMGGVDGAAMDAEGGYWAAMYGGGKLIRIMPDGAVDKEIPLPVTQPTMPAFGGPDMKTLFITTARQKLDDVALASQPLAGGLLAVSVDIPGHPVYPFGG